MDNLEKENSRLIKENEELKNNLFFLNDKLSKSEKLKGHFISNITNEIINPFTSIMALAENIRQLNNNDIAKAKRMAEMIYDEAFQLDFQLKNIFAAAIIESGLEKIELTKINLEEFSNHISQYFSASLEKKSMKLSVSFKSNEINELENGWSILNDREKLDLIILNLISNSIKFSPENSVIELKFEVNRDKLIVEVLDNGIGIEPKFRKLIFDRFKQLNDNINSINKGHGLGLSIVQAYVDFLNGELTLNDNNDCGLAVRFEIPLDLNSDLGDLDDFIFESETMF